MAPSIFIDNESDFNSISSPPAKAAVSSTDSRVLLLAPPSIASHEEKLRSVLASHDRSSTDLQMLDRVSAGLVTLADARYDLVTILTDADGTRKESSQLLSRHVFAKIVPAIKAGGKLQAQDGTLGQNVESEESREAILAGLVLEADFMRKPNQSDAVPLRLLRRNPKAVVSPSRPPTAAPLSSNGKRKSVDMSQSKSNGVGFVDFSDDLEDLMITGEEDDELIDEDTLLTEEDLSRPVDIPPECAPRAGKRRRACKDCTCGLAQKLAAEDKVAREDADAQLRTLKLGADDLAEVDFTIQGKVGSCGNCSLGDAFRCDGCPYIGMPAFQPGEEVRLLNNELQL